MKLALVAAATSLVFASPSSAQQQPASYGTAIPLERARQIVDAAQQTARGRNYTMAFAVVDPSGELLLFERMDGTQYGSTLVALEKARTAARFKRSTKVFSDTIAGGRNAVLGLPGVLAIEGGVPIVMEGRIVGALGVSGGTAEQDGEIAAVGLTEIR